MADVPGVRWLNSLGRYASDLAQWLWRTQPLLALLAAIVVSSLVWIVFSSCLERRVRLVGIALQLLGVILVAVGLRDTRRAFEDQPTTWQAIKEWWLGRPRFGPRDIVLQAAGVAAGASFGSARARVSPGPNTPLERRVEMLQEQYAELFDEVGALANEIKKRDDELSNALKVESDERQKGDASTRAQLKRAVGQGIPLGRVGAILFFLGIIAATASPEIANLFGAGACP
jgi:hypothetical protein